MNQTALLAIAVAAGFAGGFVGSVLTSPAPVDGSGAADGEANPVLESSVYDLQDRMNALEASADALELSVSVIGGRYDDLAARLPGRNPSGQSGAAGSAASEVPALAAGDLPTGPGFDAAVNAVIEQREAAEEAERQAERDRRQREALERRVDRMAEELNLDPGQKTKMVDALADSNKKREEWIRSMREQAEASDGGMGWDREAARTQMEQFRAEELEAMGKFLSADQLAKYEAMPTNNFRRGGDFGGGGQRGGGQRGGGD